MSRWTLMPRHSPESIDVNADLGESFGVWRMGDDDALMPLISSANVACGFHAGDPRTLLHSVRLAAEYDVVVGAQVSYQDLVGFGRRQMDVSPDELTADVLYQLAALDGLCRTTGHRVRYLKPHGALYHRTLVDPVQARAVVAAVRAWPEDLPIVTMAGSELAQAAADDHVRVVREGFADRAYGPDGQLVPRGVPGAVLHDAPEVAAQALRLARSGHVDSICLHGDTPEALAHATSVRTALAAEGVSVASFA